VFVGGAVLVGGSAFGTVGLSAILLALRFVMSSSLDLTDDRFGFRINGRFLLVCRRWLAGFGLVRHCLILRFLAFK
jgi:hypothetical protein